jgi:hypothetical protein
VQRAAKDLAVRGDLRVRPIMMGLAYTAVVGRLATTAAIVAGYAFSAGSGWSRGRGYA